MNRFALLLAVTIASSIAVRAWAGAPDLHAAQPGPGVRHAQPPARLSKPLVAEVRATAGNATLRFDPEAVDELKAINGRILIDSFPLSADHAADLELERFRIVQPGAQFVLGRAHGDNAPLAFDPESIILLRGRIADQPQSRVYLALSPNMSNGIIESGAGRFGLVSRAPAASDDGEPAAPWTVSVFRALAAGPNPAPFCALAASPHMGDPLPARVASPQAAGTPPDAIHGLRQVQLAIETDHEFYLIFNDAGAAAAYVVQLYGAVSDVFMANLNTRIDLTFVRIWDTPSEPFEAGLVPFRQYWNANMQSVARDAAQMFSGRGDLPGGVAYLNALCGNFAYSFCGNAIGYFAGPDQSSVYNYDILVAAHELGHNFGSLHTDAYGLDICNQVGTPPQRGTLMSYCSQTVSGGNAVMDMAFHKVTQDAMRDHVYQAPCVSFDCNQNGATDLLDILVGNSLDTNSNNVPDECEDCNANGTLDPADIASAASSDENLNGIPDECEPDCNGNGVPDDLDILRGTSQDVHGNNIPDECELDCDNNGVSDYNQIMADMTLDRNRNVILDSCEDCDADGTVDAVELDGAWNAWAAGGGDAIIREYHAVTGVLMRGSDAGHVNQPYDLVVAPGRRVLVSNTATNTIAEFSHQGQFVGNLVVAGGGGLSAPTGMALSPRGTLLVASNANARVIEYDLATGAFVSTFVAPGSGGLTAPLALAFGPDGHLYVSSASNQVFKYNGSSGAFMSIFIPAAANGGLNGPRGMLFKPDGNLLVTSYGNDSVREYDGSTGASLGVWSVIGVAFHGPWCIRLAPNGLVHVSANLVPESHLTQARVHEFDVDTGNWVRGFIMGADTMLTDATGFDYLPGDAADCNMNQVPDNCDISSGFSHDRNKNGVPDECDAPCPADISGNGSVDVSDLLAVINAWGPCPSPCAADIVANGQVDVSDLLAVINAWGECP